MFLSKIQQTAVNGLSDYHVGRLDHLYAHLSHRRLRWSTVVKGGITEVSQKDTFVQLPSCIQTVPFGAKAEHDASGDDNHKWNIQNKKNV